MYRLFAALPVPPEISAPLRKLQKDLPGASWRPEENFHVTLCFYGELSDTQARDLDELLAEIEADAFDMRVEGMGWFGRREPSAVWARIGESDELRALASQCERAARRLGIPLEKHPFTPHITLAYLHGTSLDTVRDWTEAHQAHRSAPFRASLFHLYASIPRRSGGPSRYDPMADYPLRDLRAGFD
ncbi:2'-5' RNA ligase [Hyphomonas sp. CACIAM 19H1]|uniref:RNA 2',3'-cyclic phosphodiesterase n=1 Tax=Hyphomonas sp. CACIAM 19H1 TaxID=1873716 RepID=UPI000DED3A73|nr:RNA 2',3'-cyclic phosphodiesterase [Hyphomonas sp. CACIAM 19H1]AXE65618.1 2'-5' RNA ligase [Hyphomonas sp. CACIAM 19H1]